VLVIFMLCAMNVATESISDCTSYAMQLTATPMHNLEQACPELAKPIILQKIEESGFKDGIVQFFCVNNDGPRA